MSNQLMKALRMGRFLASSCLVLYSWALGIHVAKTPGEFLVVAVGLMVGHLSLYRIMVGPSLAPGAPWRRLGRGSDA